ncbi:cache domain-containing protein [Psychrobium sp. 1_MG-2023]|uniref:cache domain-containing protein n=1 Tax=Psychrobium sp. 1_MG-2023 TaxID=3062624 RepID=UPI000C3392FB|nr:cache domain-containing protein [Psychrobium sp. 1_MG-2023]MDP2559651.1 cache domain-containing protein [Psychrobium sp. 1_MG-2023]PKF59482.1 PAS sensor protein [Alteromonadales bacterium alter-6D02]
MLLQRKLSHVFFMTIVSILLAFFIVIHWYSVPLINKEVFESERNASRLVLNNVYELADKMHLTLEDYQAQTITGHKKRMQAVVDLSADYIEHSLFRAEQLGISRSIALSQVFSSLRDFDYDQTGYVWVANKDAFMLSHPDPTYHQTDASALKDVTGTLIIAEVIKQVSKQGDGFHQYFWQPMGQSQALEKISYVKYFPQWDVFIGTGVYLNDIDAEVELKRRKLLAELRQNMREIEIAKTGYLFIFDQQGDMLVHPNANIEQTNALSLKNPLTGQSILENLMAISDTGKELEYRWDRPDDPNNYSYNKLSQVRYLEQAGWYICSSVYVDELQSSGRLLSERIITIGLIALCVAIILAFIFSYWITQPITSLAKAAQAISEGDLTASHESAAKRKDELGVLSHAFDNMVGRLRDNIETLDLKVESRTKTLAKTNEQLQLAVEESQQAQQQLTQAQRMNAVGQLAGGLAHDFNNLLTIILGNLTAAQQRFIDNDELQKRLSPAIRASRRGSELTSRLLIFSRRQSLVPQWVNIIDLINDTVTLVKGSLPRSVKVAVQLKELELYAYIDSGQFENCLINMILNAKDAQPHGGLITIKLTQENILELSDFDEPVPAGEYLCLAISDQGCGFSKENISKVFEPFFTTKESNRGAGLGLSMVFGFVKQSQGFIRASNNAIGGACLTILLPVIKRSPESFDVTSNDNFISLGAFKNKLVLLVEDDQDVRQVVREQLISFGFNVIEASDSDEAILLIETIKGLYAMVSDISMPGQLNGFELAQLFTSKVNSQTIVLMSGYAYDEGEDVQLNRFPLLQKPFAADELLAALCSQAKEST